MVQVSYRIMVFNGHFQQYFSYIVVVGFIGGGNQSTRRKRQTTTPGGWMILLPINWFLKELLVSFIICLRLYNFTLSKPLDFIWYNIWRRELLNAYFVHVTWILIWSFKLLQSLCLYPSLTHCGIKYPKYIMLSIIVILLKE